MLPQNLKKLRKEKRLTQKEFASLMKVSQQTIASWESGRAVPGSDTLNKLADFFNVSTDYLLGREIYAKEQKINQSVDDAIKSMHHYQGKPVSDADKEVIKGILHGYFASKQ